GKIRVGLHGVAERVRQGAEGAIEIAVGRFDARAAVNVGRRGGLVGVERARPVSGGLVPVVRCIHRRIGMTRGTLRKFTRGHGSIPPFASRRMGYLRDEAGAKKSWPTIIQTPPQNR